MIFWPTEHSTSFCDQGRLSNHCSKGVYILGTAILYVQMGGLALVRSRVLLMTTWWWYCHSGPSISGSHVLAARIVIIDCCSSLVYWLNLAELSSNMAES